MSTANEDFPRGLWQTSGSVSNGPTASIIFPAMAGIQWVLDEIEAVLLCTASATNLSYVVNVTPPTVGVNVIVGLLVVSTGAAPYSVWAKDTWTWQGQAIYPTNTAVTISFSSGTSATIAELLNVQAYP